MNAALRGAALRRTLMPTLAEYHPAIEETFLLS